LGILGIEQTAVGLLPRLPRKIGVLTTTHLDLVRKHGGSINVFLGGRGFILWGYRGVYHQQHVE
jgi:hypothetical protein